MKDEIRLVIRDELREFFSDRYDPENGWKSDRARFEGCVEERLTSIEKSVEKIPDLVLDVEKNSGFRKIFMKSLYVILSTLVLIGVMWWTGVY